MSLTCMNIGGRGRYRTADRWCVKLPCSVPRLQLWSLPTIIVVASCVSPSPVVEQTRSPTPAATQVTLDRRTALPQKFLGSDPIFALPSRLPLGARKVGSPPPVMA